MITASMKRWILGAADVGRGLEPACRCLPSPVWPGVSVPPWRACGLGERVAVAAGTTTSGRARGVEPRGARRGIHGSVKAINTYAYLLYSRAVERTERDALSILQRADAEGPWRLGTLAGRPRILGRIAGGWAYEMHLHLENGRPVIAQLHVFSDSPAVDRERLMDAHALWTQLGMADEAAETARDLARLETSAAPSGAVPVPAGGLAARHLRSIPFRQSPPALITEGWRRIRAELRQAYRRERAQERGDVRLARVANLYVEALQRGSRTQVIDVARQLGVPAAHVRDAVSAARRRGLLTATRSQGVPGGELTAKAHALLGQMAAVGPAVPPGPGSPRRPSRGAPTTAPRPSPKPETSSRRRR